MMKDNSAADIDYIILGLLLLSFVFLEWKDFPLNIK
jgi:hypothetical protein